MEICCGRCCHGRVSWVLAERRRGEMWWGEQCQWCRAETTILSKTLHLQWRLWRMILPVECSVIVLINIEEKWEHVGDDSKHSHECHQQPLNNKLKKISNFVRQQHWILCLNNLDHDWGDARLNYCGSASQCLFLLNFSDQLKDGQHGLLVINSLETVSSVEDNIWYKSTTWQCKNMVLV